MGWSKWFGDGKESVSEKTVKTSEGTEKHFLRTNSGSKENHTHVVVKEKNSGKTSAHIAGPKDRR